MTTPLSELTAQLVALPPSERASAINAFSGGLDAHLGLVFTWCAEDRVVAELTTRAHHTQVYGLVHGGVYCSMVEAVGSCGAAMRHIPEGRLPVGIDNHTQFLRGVRTGTTLTATGIPARSNADGSTWTVRILDQDGTLCATGQLTTRALPPGRSVGGAALRIPDPEQ